MLATFTVALGAYSWHVTIFHATHLLKLMPTHRALILIIGMLIFLRLLISFLIPSFGLDFISLFRFKFIGIG
jgi:hypothetical protein